MQATSAREVRLNTAVNLRVIPGLDALRVVSILLVVTYHSGAQVPGPMGVIVFFVLSGFLITSLLLKEIAAKGSISILDFYRRRAYRIFPTFYVCWLLTILFMRWQQQKIYWPHAMESFFYLADYGRASPSALRFNFPMGISWSLAVEEQFYLLWPLTLGWMIRLRKPARAVAFVIGGIWLWRAILMLGFHVPLPYILNAFDTRADAILVGCWLALMVCRTKVEKPLLWLLANKWQVALPMAALLLISFVDPRMDAPSLQIIDLTIQPILIAMLLLQLAFWGTNEWSFLDHPIVKFFARLSYAIYLYHPLTTEIVNLRHMHHNRGLLGAMMVVPVAAGSYYLIERPFMRMRDRGKRQSVLMDDGLKQANTVVRVPDITSSGRSL